VGTRVKNFESTGIAPYGRLYAGDLNAIQDQYADQSNFAQTIDLANLRVGDPSIQLLQYGAAEARLSAALRTDGIFRGLGGIALAAFTTAQRDALTAAQRPYGLLILNTTTNRLEWNIGTPTSPVWQTILQGTLPDPEIVGVIKMWGGDAAPAGFLLCDGSVISRSTFSALFGVIGTKFGTGDGSTTFNLPDMRGRAPAGLNTAGAIGNHAAVGNNEGVGVAARRFFHRHSIGDPQHRHQIINPGSALGTGGAGGVSGPAFWDWGTYSPTGITVGPQSGNEPVDTIPFLTVNFIIKA
jgi:microcystin-dependent protein